MYYMHKMHKTVPRGVLSIWILLLIWKNITQFSDNVIFDGTCTVQCVIMYNIYQVYAQICLFSFKLLMLVVLHSDLQNKLSKI